MTRTLQTLAIIAAVVIIALTAGAFWLSYAHLHAVAAEHGLASAPARAWAWPACLDLFIVAGEVLMLRAALRRTVDPWAIGLTVVGSAGSIALNVAGVGANAAFLDYVVAAVPPTAALLAFGALLRQLHEHLAPAGEDADSEPVEETPAPAAVERVRTRPAVVPAGVRLLPMVARPVPVVTLERDDQQDAQDAPEDAPRTRELEASGPQLLTSAEVAERIGIKPSTLRNWIHDGRLSSTARDERGHHLFDPAQLEEVWP